jgi:hypothetical protein
LKRARRSKAIAIVLDEVVLVLHLQSGNPDIARFTNTGETYEHEHEHEHRFAEHEHEHRFAEHEQEHEQEHEED